MRKVYICAVLMFLCSFCHADCVVDMTTAQLKNIDIIHYACVEVYPSFGGFTTGNGGVIATGVDDAGGLQAFIDTVDLNDTDKVPRKKDIKSLRQKFKAMGLDNKDLALLGLEL